MHQMVGGLAKSLAAFMTDLGSLKTKVRLVMISEFGRCVEENGNRGLDHGWGNMMPLMGAGVKGGQYDGNWPWLGANKLVDGDLKVTTDYRQVLGEVVTRCFNRSIAAVFLLWTTLRSWSRTVPVATTGPNCCAERPAPVHAG